MAAIIKVLAYGLALGLYLLHLKKGVVTSGALFTFWFLSAILGIMTFRSVLMTDYVSGDTRLAPFTNYVIQYPLVVAISFLNCWADARPSYVNLDGDLFSVAVYSSQISLFSFHLDNVSNLTPEKYASFLSKTIFAWFDGLCIKGWKGQLTVKDLWTLTKENRY